MAINLRTYMPANQLLVVVVATYCGGLHMQIQEQMHI